MKTEEPINSRPEGRQITSPEQTGDYVRVTSVSPFLIGSAILLMLVAFVVWGVLGTVTDRVEYSGLIFPHHGTDDITLTKEGSITKMLVHTGDTIVEGQEVARVVIGHKDSIVKSAVTGTVMHTKQERDTFEPLEPIVSIVCEHKADNSVHTMLMAFVNIETQHSLRVGMEAQVWPKGEDRDEIGYVRGTIVSIDRYPTPVAEIISQLKNATMVEPLYDTNGPAWQVIIELHEKPGDASRYDWSFGQPKHVDMGIGTFCNIITETRHRSMYEYLFKR